MKILLGDFNNLLTRHLILSIVYIWVIVNLVLSFILHLSNCVMLCAVVLYVVCFMTCFTFDCLQTEL
jgi:hypothetical protein